MHDARAPFEPVIRAYLAFCRNEKDNGDNWLRFQRGTLENFQAWAVKEGASSLEELEPYHLSEYLEHRAQQGDARNTLHRRAVIVRGMVRWAEGVGKVRACALSRAAAPRVARVQREIPEYDHALALILGEKNIHFRDFFLLLILTGLRRGELLALTWSRIDLEQGIAEVKATDEWKPKGKKARAVPLEQAALEILKRRRKLCDTGPFIKRGKPIAQPWTFTKAFKKLAVAAGLPKMRMHDNRHEFGTRLARIPGVELTTCQTVLGHARIETTMIYAHARKDSAIVARAALDKAAKEKTTTA